MQVIPDYQGDPEYDAFLHDVDIPHGGHEEDPLRQHLRALHRVVESLWDQPRVRRQMVRDMWAGTKGFVPEYYDAKHTFQEDATKCWLSHHRPGISTHKCSDYRNENRRIGNPAYRDRLQLSQQMRSDEIKHSGPKVYLCQFCPYEMDVQHMKADRYGDFSDKLN